MIWLGRGQFLPGIESIFLACEEPAKVRSEAGMVKLFHPGLVN